MQPVQVMNQTSASQGLVARIRTQAKMLGFSACGVSDASAPSEWFANLRTYLAHDYHGDMDWLSRRVAERAAPKALWDGSRSVIVVAASYRPDRLSLEKLGHTDRGIISAYARSNDYHDVVKKKLKQLARWLVDETACELKVFVDTAPVMEKPLAQKAGIGWQGKHTNLVSRELGSWFFLGVIYCDLELDPDAAESDHCGSCRACLDICPTRAFPAPYQLDARRCISYLTIEHKGHIDRQFRIPMGNRVYGCDDCIAVCPWNKFAVDTAVPELLPRESLTDPRLIELSKLDDAGFRTLFRGSPIKRTGRNRFVRNVLIALGNSGNPAALSTIADRLLDNSPLVRAMAVWAMARLADTTDFVAARRQYAARETDPSVRSEWFAA